MSTQTVDEQIPTAIRADAPTQTIIREQIWRPVVRKNDWRAFAIVGREGSGKSLTCASILKAVDPSFGVDRIHFNPVPFLEDIGEQTAEPGRATMSDESGVAFGNRTWYDREQVEANQYLQTARDDNRIIGLTAPRLEEIDKQLQGRLHILAEVEKKKPGAWVELRWKKLDPSRGGQNKIYQKYPRMRINNRTQKVTRIKIGPPPQDLVEPYLKKKAEWKGDLKDRVVSQYADEEAKKEKQKSLPEVAEEIKENGAEKVSSIHGGNGQQFISWELIKLHYNLSQNDAKTVQKLLKNDEEFDLDD